MATVSLQPKSGTLQRTRANKMQPQWVGFTWKQRQLLALPVDCSHKELQKPLPLLPILVTTKESNCLKDTSLSSFLRPHLRYLERNTFSFGSILSLPRVSTTLSKWLVITLNNGVMDLLFKAHGDSRYPKNSVRDPSLSSRKGQSWAAPPPLAALAWGPRPSGGCNSGSPACLVGENRRERSKSRLQNLLPY